jgi:hypothetical protein
MKSELKSERGVNGKRISMKLEVLLIIMIQQRIKLLGRNRTISRRYREKAAYALKEVFRRLLWSNLRLTRFLI